MQYLSFQVVGWAGYEADYIVRPYGTLPAHHVPDFPEVETSGNKMGRPAGTD